jgi:hypothetical protein
MHSALLSAIQEPGSGNKQREERAVAEAEVEVDEKADIDSAGSLILACGFSYSCGFSMPMRGMARASGTADSSRRIGEDILN